jgi:hypothetical protein
LVSKKILLGILVVIIAIPTAYYLVSPLFINVTVQEDVQTQPGASMVVLATGTFMDADNFHKASGIAKLMRNADGTFLIRLEGFQVTNGPDLYVYLSDSKDASGMFVDLGRLKGNIGDQNYNIPTGMNPEGYKYVLIWCRAFSVLFGYAELMRQ